MAGWSCNHPMAQAPRSIVRNPLFSFEALDTGHRTRLNGCRKRPISTWTDVKARCRRRQANARGRVGSFKVSSRAPRVLVSTSPPLSLWRGLEYQPAHQRTHNKLTPWLACNSNSKTYQHLRKLAVEVGSLGAALCCSATRPLFACPPPPVPASLGGEHPFREMQDTCIDSHATDEPRGGFVFGLPCFVDSDSIKGRTQRRLRALHSVEGRGKERAFQPRSTRVGRLAGQAETA